MRERKDSGNSYEVDQVHIKESGLVVEFRREIDPCLKHSYVIDVCLLFCSLPKDLEN